MNDLCKAVDHCDIALVRLILSNGISIDKKKYCKLVVKAVKKDNLELVRTLLIHHREKYAYQEDPVEIAISNNNEKMANMIISKYQSISIKKSSLELAAMKGMSSTVELIVSITYKLKDVVRTLKKCVVNDDIITLGIIIAYFGRSIIFHELDGASAFSLAKYDAHKLFTKVLNNEIPYLTTKRTRCYGCQVEIAGHRVERCNGYGHYCLYCYIKNDFGPATRREKLYDFTEFEKQRSFSSKPSRQSQTHRCTIS